MSSSSLVMSNDEVMVRFETREPWEQVERETRAGPLSPHVTLCNLCQLVLKFRCRARHQPKLQTTNFSSLPLLAIGTSIVSHFHAPPPAVNLRTSYLLLASAPPQRTERKRTLPHHSSSSSSPSAMKSRRCAIDSTPHQTSKWEKNHLTHLQDQRTGH